MAQGLAHQPTFVPPCWTIEQIMVNRLPGRVAVHALGGVDLGDPVEVEVQRDVSDAKLCKQAGLHASQAHNKFLKFFQWEGGVNLGQLGMA